MKTSRLSACLCLIGLLRAGTPSGVMAAPPPPDWVVNNGIAAAYPGDRFVCGWGMAEGTSAAQRREDAEKRALADLSSRFMARIHSELLSQTEEDNRKVSGAFRNTISLETRLTLLNTRVEHWADDAHKRAFALAVMEIQPAVKNYNTRIGDTLQRLQGLVADARRAEERGDVALALKCYRQMLPLFIELGEARTVVKLLGGTPAGENLEWTYERIEGEIGKLLTVRIASLKGAAEALAEQLALQARFPHPTCVFPLTYRDTDFASEFSAYFRPLLEGALATRTAVIPPDRAAGVKSLNLTGTYWTRGTNGDQVEIQVCVADARTGARLAAATVLIPETVFKSEGITPVPRNFRQALADTGVISAGDVIPGALGLEVWTSRGREHLLFKEGDTFQIMVRVNKPSHLQAIYHMANGVRLLLYNNLYIDAAKVNRVFTLPDTFTVCPPLGVERLQIFARTAEFEEAPVTTATFDGETYPNVFTADIKQHTARMRGIKVAANQPVENADRAITLTTVKP